MTKERKYILSVGCVLLIVAFGYRFYPSENNLLSNTGTIELKTKKVSKYLSVVKKRKEIDAQINSLKETFRISSKALLNGRTPALAGVDIQNVLNKIAQEVGIRIDRVDVKKKEGGLKKQDDKKDIDILINIPVRFRIVSTVEQLQKFIYMIESSNKLLRIVNFNAKVGKVKYPEQIITDIIVEGFVLSS